MAQAGDMLSAKRALELPRSLDNFDYLVIEVVELGYPPQGAEKSEVLFSSIAECCERRSLRVSHLQPGV